MDSELNYKKSKILLFTDRAYFYFDGTLQSVLQRRNTLRHQHKKDELSRLFFRKCEVHVIEEFSAESREELNKRVQLYDMLFNLDDLKSCNGNYSKLKQLCQQKLGLRTEKMKRAPVSFTVRFD